MDFSSAGYQGGGVALPSPAAVVTVTPLGGGADDTANIQDAINQVSSRTPDASGFRGAIQLSAGNFLVGQTLTISASGVVLRGSGSGLDGTIITNTSPLQNGPDPNTPGISQTGQTLLTVMGNLKASVDAASTTAVVDAYVPSGTTALTLAKTDVFKVGDRVQVARPVTSAWISFMGMDKLGPGQNWLTPGSSTKWQRTITAIQNNQVTLDVPLSDSMDAMYLAPPGATVSKVSVSGALQQVGVEHIRFVGVPRRLSTNNTMMVMDEVADSWVNDVVGDNFTGGLTVGGKSIRITAKSVLLTHENNDASIPCTGAKFAEFSINGSQVLLDGAGSTGAKASFYVVTGATVSGPNVALNFKGVPDSVCSMSSIQPHQRWATGLLVDGADLAPNQHGNSANQASIDFTNRANAGSGQGWAIGWGVIWNSKASFDVQAPPGSTNWVIGGVGTVVPQTTESPGQFDSPNVPVAPQSLYLAQLCQRLGPQALSNVGY